MRSATMLAELGKLPTRQRAVLVLRYYEGFSDGRIAELLGLAPGTVRGYAARALASMRIEMAPERPAERIGLTVENRRLS
jgi:RNA polymerase sigma factor (sigma-70 family)